MIDWINDLLATEGSSGRTEELSSGLRRTLLQLLRDCDSIYRSAAKQCIYGAPEYVAGDDESFHELMRDLHRGVLVKTLIEIAHCDRRWNRAEREVAIIVLRHAWGVSLTNQSLAKALEKVVKHAELLKWTELLKPFLENPMLSQDLGELRSIVLRLANLIAKADGNVTAGELVQLEKLKSDLDSACNRNRKEAAKSKSKRPGAIDVQAAKLVHPEKEHAAHKSKTQSGGAVEPDSQQREQMFSAALSELDALIGLEAIKTDIQQLIAFLKIQSARKQHQLPTAEVSLHAIFKGNPGTGKTTVARIVSRLLCGLGILGTGQTIETDRSGLVAQYAGQTGPRTNERVDEALGGVLFVDEAYSLVAEQGDDPYGVEAVQALLKRIEDDRDRFVVVLAGYPAPMEQMLRSNPGLSSRFQRTFYFSDYDARDLLRIFYSFCRKYHYRLPRPTRKKLLLGFKQLVDAKDEHFGNGRLARNVFESSIRQLSSRIVNITPLTRELLTTIEPEDIRFDSLKV